MSHITSQALIDFVYHEADLLDTKALDAWLALFAQDGG
jgi:3-phenylpropionate/cinnamic acid dioxygenase small subunit